MDPGVYLLTGKWLSQHGNLTVPAAASWGNKGNIFTLPSSGMYQMHDGTLQFQFAHMLGVLLAGGNYVGGDGLMFRVPALLGALGLCSLYAVGCRLVRRPWIVLGSVVGLAVALPELNVTRDSFSEPLTQFLLWSRILLMLRAYRTRSGAIAFIAGLAIGGTLMSHIDAAIYLIPLPPLAALAWITTRDREDRKATARMVGCGLLGVLPSALLGTWDVQNRAGNYYEDLSTQMHSIYKLLAVSALASILVVVLWTAIPSVARTAGVVYRRYRRQAGVVVASVVGAVLVVGWSVRPLIQSKTSGSTGSVAALQGALGLPAQPHRTYSEQTLRWFEWYIGPIALALAVVGISILLVWAIRFGSPTATVVLAMTGGITLLYLWNPEANPIQIWATRRFATAGFPLFMLAAALAIDFGITVAARNAVGATWPRRVAYGATAGLVLFPLATSWPVRNFSSQANFLPLIEHACTAIGPNAAIAVTATGNLNSDTIPITYEDWCHAPVATLNANTTPAALTSAAEKFRQEGRQLWALGPTAASITAVLPTATPSFIGAARSTHELQYTLVTPPDDYATDALSIFAAQVP